MAASHKCWQVHDRHYFNRELELQIRKAAELASAYIKPIYLQHMLEMHRPGIGLEKLMVGRGRDGQFSEGPRSSTEVPLTFRVQMKIPALMRPSSRVPS